MRKNPNKAAGNWGALKTKPQNLVPFKSGGKVSVTAGGEKHVIYKKTTKRGEGKIGNVMVNHPTKDKGVWDTIDLTKKSGAKTIQQGVASTKKWHKQNPYNDMKKQLTKKQGGGPMKKASPTPPMMSPYMDKAGKAKMASPKTKAMEGQFKNTPPTGSNPLKKPNVLDNGVYRGPKVTPAQIKQFQEDWKKKERAATNPKNKPAGSPMRKLQNGGTTKKKDVISSDLRERLVRQQKNKPVPGVMNYKTSENWADNYSLDTTGLAKGSSNYYPYSRSNGTKGVLTRPEAKKAVKAVKSGKLKTSDWNFKSGGTVKKYQAGGTADSTKYFYDKSMKELLNANKILEKEGAYNKNFQEADKAATKSSADYLRQIRKGRSGYDKNGYPIKKK